MDLDIIICAVIAVALFARLWTVLGRRNDEDKQRPNPFITPVIRPDIAPSGTGQLGPPRPPLLQAFKIAPASLAGGLEQIQSRDPGFNEKQFLQSAKLDFAMIVEDFAKGDMARITRLLTPIVRTHFQSALDIRRNAGQVVESKITSIKDVETTTARLDGDQAFITVRFVTNQENVLRDSQGQIIGGEVGKLEEITDLWTFTRDMTLTNGKVTDTNWLLAETGA